MGAAEQAWAELPEIATIMGIKGVGLVTAAGIIAEVGDFRRFDSPWADSEACWPGHRRKQFRQAPGQDRHKQEGPQSS
jgi:hypothetical protein